VVRLALTSRRRRVVSGSEAMVGAPARVLDWQATSGHVEVAGERWIAHGTAGLAPGQAVRVRAVHGLQLEIEPDVPNTTTIVGDRP
jgi:membrane-bound serine protease (ClpP class)